MIARDMHLALLKGRRLNQRMALQRLKLAADLVRPTREQFDGEFLHNDQVIAVLSIGIGRSCGKIGVAEPFG